MDIIEIASELDSLTMSDKDKLAMSKLIDLKTNENMKEVINEIRSLRSDMDSKFMAIDSKFQAVDMRLKTLYWIIGGIATVGVALYAALVGVILR